MKCAQHLPRGKDFCLQTASRLRIVTSPPAQISSLLAGLADLGPASPHNHNSILDNLSGIDIHRHIPMYMHLNDIDINIDDMGMDRDRDKRHRERDRDRAVYTHISHWFCLSREP